MANLSELERFWAKVHKAETCWVWQGATTDGYGRAWIGQKLLRAHRVSFELAHGPIPDGMFLDHICYNRSCVNPDHLRLATPKQNVENRTGARASNRSGVVGVFRHRQSGKWQARVVHNGHAYHAGLHADMADAEAAVVAKRNELFTHNDLDRV